MAMPSLDWVRFLCQLDTPKCSAYRFLNQLAESLKNEVCSQSRKFDHCSVDRRCWKGKKTLAVIQGPKGGMFLQMNVFIKHACKRQLTQRSRLLIQSVFLNWFKSGVECLLRQKLAQRQEIVCWVKYTGVLFVTDDR